jgi:hypothetical protein
MEKFKEAIREKLQRKGGSSHCAESLLEMCPTSRKNASDRKQRQKRKPPARTLFAPYLVAPGQVAKNGCLQSPPPPLLIYNERRKRLISRHYVESLAGTFRLVKTGPITFMIAIVIDQLLTRISRLRVRTSASSSFSPFPPRPATPPDGTFVEGLGR